MSLIFLLFVLSAAASGQVPEAELEALYGPGSAGTGIRTTAIVPEDPCATGEFLKVDSDADGVDCADLEASDIPDLGAAKIASGTLDDARIPSGIARDSELPDTDSFLERSDIVAGSNVTLTEGSGNTVTIAASGGGMGSDGVVDGVTFSEATGEITLSRTIGADITRKIDEILRVASGDTLPAAEDNEGRIAVSGNALFESRFVVTEQAHDRSVTLMTLPVGGVTISGTVYGSNYAGNFAAAPLATNYSLNEFIWDRGSQVWLLNATSSLGARHWLSYSGPAHFRHGVYYSDANAGSHANGVGEIFIVGSGSSQLVRYVSSFTAATNEQSGWIWQGLGTDLAGIESVITGRLSDDTPAAVATAGSSGAGSDASREDHGHAGVTSIAVAGTGVAVNQAQGAVTVTGDVDTRIGTHNTSATAHNDIRSDVSDVEDRLDALDPLEIEAYDSTATYSRGSANSIVTHSSGLFIYISTAERSSGHDPDTQPGYWLELSEGVAYEVITTGSHRIAARTIIVNGDNDNVYLCTTTQTTPRDLDYIHAQSETTGGSFILLNGAGSGGGFTLRQGTTAPSSSLGDDGDWYLRTSNGQWYERASGTWASRYTDQLGQAGTGLTAVSTETSLTGDGTSSDPLDIADGGVGTGNLADDAVTGDKIADSTIHGGALIDGTIATIKIGDGQVTGAKLSSNSVSTGKVADDAVTTAKIDGDAITTAKIAAGAVGSSDIASFAVLASKINSNAVTSAKIAADAVTAAKIADGAVTTAKLAANAAGEGKVPIDDTMQFDGSGDLGVNITTVTEHLDEDIRYYSDDTTREDAHQASKGVVFEDTSRFAKNIHSVEWDFEGDGIGNNYATFLVGIDSSDDISIIYGQSDVLFNVTTSGTHRTTFGTEGVRVPGDVERLGVFLTRTGSPQDATHETKVYRGQPADDSPRESYPSASLDFPFWRSARFDSARPEIGERIDNYITNGEIYGYPKIRYSIEVEHAPFVGDGTVSSAHISSGSAAADEVLKADGSGGAAFGAVVVHGSNIVDNTIPTAKYGNLTLTGPKMASAAVSTAKVADGAITAAKLAGFGVTHIESGATYNNNVITVSTAETVRGGDSILFAVPSPFGTSATQEISLDIDGQADAEWPLHDRNGDALHEDDLAANSVYIAISDADSWDILVLPDETGSGGGSDIAVQEEGTEVTSAATEFNFTGAGATATASNGTVTVDIPAAAGGGNATRIVTGAAWDSGAGGNESFTATGWRNCDLLLPVFEDSGELAPLTSNSSKPFHAVDMFLADALDTEGSLYVGVSQNEGVRILEVSQTTDELSFQWVGGSPAPAQGDTMDLWCLNTGAAPSVTAIQTDSSIACSSAVWDETTIDVPTTAWGLGQLRNL